MNSSILHIGWASADITPEQPVVITGQFYARVSEGVMDPVTATALALESADPVPGSAGAAILVSCDLVSIADNLRDAVRERVAAQVPGLDPRAVCLSATHTHTAPETRIGDDPVRDGSRFGLSPEELGVMHADDYVAFAADRIADAAVRAWNERAPGGIGFGLAQATLGCNRRMCFANGQTVMYGNPNDPDFRHIEGSADPSLNLLCTYDGDRNLTGMVVNVACPAQVSMHEYQISADYWHEAREALRNRLGASLFILPQCSAAGDQNPLHPRIMIDWKAQERMWALMQSTQRREMGDRIANAVSGIVPHVGKAIAFAPQFGHRVDEVDIPCRTLREADVRDALAEAADWQRKYDALRAELDAQPERKQQPRWYRDISMAYRRMCWYRNVETRFAKQQQTPFKTVELTHLRLGDLALTTNPFECYLDYGLQIKARSPAVQTFIVQLAGGGSYLPTERAVAGGSYGAVPASTPIGPEGGQAVVEHALDALNTLWTDPS